MTSGRVGRGRVSWGGIVGLAGALALVLGCGEGRKTPAQVVEAAYRAANDGRYSEADGYLSTSALTAANSALVAAQGGTKGIWDGRTQRGTIESIEIVGEEVRGEGAVVAYRLCFKGGATREDRDPLIREKGLWKITFGEAPMLSSPALSGTVVPLTKKPPAEAPPGAWPFEAFAAPGAKTITNSIGMKLVLIAPGSFQMGDNDAGPVLRVTISRPFYLAATEVTQAQWQGVMGYNPSHFRGPDLPVEMVSWNDCVDFCSRLTQKEQTEGKIGKGAAYRLPTEAEWEYACRAGSTTKFSFGDSDAELGQHAWYGQNSDQKTHPVGQKRANAWGLYDMHGNVWEWADWFGPYPSGDQKDPVGPPNGGARVLRGGGRGSGPAHCRSAARERAASGDRGDGFRLVFVPGP